MSKKPSSKPSRFVHIIAKSLIDSLKMYFEKLPKPLSDEMVRVTVTFVKRVGTLVNSGVVLGLAAILLRFAFGTWPNLAEAFHVCRILMHL